MSVQLLFITHQIDKIMFGSQEWTGKQVLIHEVTLGSYANTVALPMWNTVAKAHRFNTAMFQSYHC